MKTTNRICNTKNNTLQKFLLVILACCFIGCLSKSDDDDKVIENSANKNHQAEENNDKKLNSQENESFFNFYEKFYRNENFQIERIKFPLPGLNKQDMGVLDTIYYWKKDNWRFLDFNQFGITKDYQKCLYFEFSKGKVIEEFTAEKDPGFVFIREFKKIEGKWHLVYMVEAL